jgi:hypothetical protein
MAWPRLFVRTIKAIIMASVVPVAAIILDRRQCVHPHKVIVPDGHLGSNS